MPRRGWVLCPIGTRPVYDSEEEQGFYLESDSDIPPPPKRRDSGSKAPEVGADAEIAGGVYNEANPLKVLGEVMGGIGDEGWGEFTFGGDALLPTEDIRIEGYGKLNLPITDKKDAEKLMKACGEQAPFGRGQRTMVDKKVRNSWQVDGEKVKIKEDRHWKFLWNRLQEEVAEKFAVKNTKLEFKLYKFLLYGPGGHFAKHRDTEKEDRMFATMVVQLPSVHKGGRLHVWKDEDSPPTIHDFGQDRVRGKKNSGDRTYYAVHYADAEHALEEVTEGYRCALVYSICWPQDNPAPPPAVGVDLGGKMRQAMRDLAEQAIGFNYFLEHDYTPKSITDMGEGAFKGRDRDRWNKIRYLNNQLDHQKRFVFLLAKAEMREAFRGMGIPAGYYDDQYWEPNEWDLPTRKFTQFYGIEGKAFGPEGKSFAEWRLSRSEDSDISYENVLNPEKKSKLKLWKGNRTTTYEGWLGNEGATKDTTYHKYVLAAWPMEKALKMLLPYLKRERVWDAVIDEASPVEHIEACLAAIIERRDNPRQGVGLRRPDEEIPVDPEDAAYEQCMFKHRVFHSMRTTPSIKSLELYIELFKGGLFACSCVGEHHRPGCEEGDENLFDILRNPEYWAAVRGKVVEAFKKDGRGGYAFAYQCAKRRFALHKWQDILDEALGAQPAPEEAELGNRSWQENIWRLVLEVEDDEFCEKTAQRYADTDPGKLEHTTAVLKERFNATPNKLNPAKRRSLQPIFQRRSDWVKNLVGVYLENEQTEGWRYPEAVFEGSAEVQEFLRGPAETYDLGGMGSIKTARKYIKEQEKVPKVKCSFKMEADGKGSGSFVKFTKDRGYAEQNKVRLQEMEQEAEALEDVLIALGPGEELASGSEDMEPVRSIGHSASRRRASKEDAAEGDKENRRSPLKKQKTG